MHNIIIKGDLIDGTDQVLTDEALRFLCLLEETFGRRRRQLLQRRVVAQRTIDAQRNVEGSAGFDFLPETVGIREGDWTITPAPDQLANRRVEITAAVDRPIMEDALRSNANVFIADFEDSTAPTWEHTIEGQVNLRDAVEGRFPDEAGRPGGPMSLVVRPRGWHLTEKHLLMDGRNLAASLVDFGLYAFHNGRSLVDLGSGVFFCLPKIENHLEARLWNDVFLFTEAYLGLSTGSIRASVLIETLPAVFQMDEILWELREHSLGLNAGRWDYIFSMIKRRATDPAAILPDRRHLTGDAPFLRAFTDLIVRTCHRRGAHAIGGISAFIRPDGATSSGVADALAALEADKRDEASHGFDGTWVSRADLVPVAKAVFDEVLGECANQIEHPGVAGTPTTDELLDVTVEGASITEEGLRTNIRVGIIYLEAWLRGNGSVAMLDHMEDTATAEICRSQVWQWMRHRVQLDDGRIVTRQLILDMVRGVTDDILWSLSDEQVADGRFGSARKLFERLATSDEFVPFLTDPAYELIA